MQIILDLFVKYMWNSPIIQIFLVVWEGKGWGLNTFLPLCETPISFLLFWSTNILKRLCVMTNIYATKEIKEGAPKEGWIGYYLLFLNRGFSLKCWCLWSSRRFCPLSFIGSILLIFSTPSIIANYMTMFKFEVILKSIHLVDKAIVSIMMIHLMTKLQRLDV